MAVTALRSLGSFTRPRSGAEPSSRRAWTITGLLVAFMLINFADKAVLGLAAVPIQDGLGISPVEYGFVASSFYFLFSAAALVVGYLAGRIPSRWLLFVMALVWALAQFPVLLSGAGLAVLLGSRIVLGAGEGPAWPVAQHAICGWFPDRARALPSSLLGLGASVGVIAGAPAITAVIVHFGWRWAFAGVGVVGLVWSLVWLLLGRDGPLDRHVADVPAQPAAEGFVPLLRLLRNRTWIGTCVAYGAFYWAMVILVAWVPAYLTKGLGYSVATAGNLDIVPWAVAGLSLFGYGIASRSLLRRGFSSRLVRGIAGGGSVALAGVAMLAMTRSGGGPLAVALLALAFGVSGPITTCAVTVIGEIAPARHRGPLLGLLTSVTAVAAVVAPTVFGWLVQSGHGAAGYRHGFELTAAILLAGGIVGIALIRPERDRRT